MFICSDLRNGILFSTCFIHFGNVLFQLLGCVLDILWSLIGELLRVEMNGCWLKWEEHVGSNFVQERRGYKEKWCGKERKGNSFRNASPQPVGQLSVEGRLANRPTDRWPNHLDSISRMLYLTEFGGFSRPTGDRTSSVPNLKCCFPVLMGRLTLGQHSTNRHVEGRLADGQPTGDRLYPVF